jgi:UPF0755 protein
MRRLFVAVLLSLALVAGGAWLWLDALLDRAGSQTELVELRVASGDSLRASLQRLEEAGAVQQSRVIERWVRWQYPNFILKTGRYAIAPGATARDIIEQLRDGKVILESLTVIEGTRFSDFRRALETHPEVKVTLRGLSDAEVMRALGLDGHPEGRFFPDTYRFAAGTTDRQLLQLAHRRMDRLLASLWAERAADLPLETPEQALVLASIVEKESGLASERARVAGVFVSRLRLGMRLQSDPTVIYGIGEDYDGNIRRVHLTTDTPYNTYTRRGLPPTPIALPSESALKAVLQPEITGDLFFVATGDADGSHRFSKTYDQHRLAVRAMLERQRMQRATTRAPGS